MNNKTFNFFFFNSFLITLLLSIFGIVQAQTISGVKTVGVGGDYTSLTKSDGLFNAVNTSTVTGNLTINIISNITDEDGNTGLNQWIESPVNSNYTLTIQSSAAVQRVLSCDPLIGFEGSFPSQKLGLFRLSGADRVYINGGTGTNHYLLFRNYAKPTSGGNENFAATLVLSNDATHNNFNNCIFEGGNPEYLVFSGRQSGVVSISFTYLTAIPPNTNTGNDYNSFTYCDVGNNANTSATSFSILAPCNCFYSYAGSPGGGQNGVSRENDHNTIDHCNIYNFAGAGIFENLSAGIFIDNNGGANGGDWVISNNSFYNNLPAASPIYYGFPSAIRFDVGTSSNGNTISNNFIGGNASALASGTLVGTWTINPNSGFAAAPSSIIINVGTGAVTNVANNTIGNISNISASTLSTTGIHCKGGNVNVTGNTISDITVTNADVIVNGISVSAGAVINVYKNKIYNLSALGSVVTTAGAVNGMVFSGGTTLKAYNNIIGNLTAPNANVTDAVRGISITSTATATYNVYYNTVYLNASSIGTNFGTSGIFHNASTTATVANLNFRNNIIVNNSNANGTGISVAYRRSAGSAGMLLNYANSSNNNLFYAGTPGISHLIYSDGVSSAQTLAQYKNGVFTAGTIAPRDVLSVTENPVFLSTTGSNLNYLHVNSSGGTLIESGAANIAGIIDDIDGDIRNNTTPDIGADEIGMSLCSTSATVNANSCNTYISPSGNYTWATSGSYMDTIFNAAGCDSVLTINLTINSTTSSQTISACDIYISPSGNYSWIFSGTYMDTIPNSMSCDSIMTIILTVKKSTTSSQTTTFCNNYTSPSGNYTWTTSGIYHDTIPNAAGCDSVIIFNLTINTADTSVTQSGNVLTANATGAIYQWLDCDNNFSIISGEISQTYTASANGNYALAITQNGCTDTSDCYTVTGVGINELQFPDFQIYPNPANEQLTVISEQLSPCKIIITNPIGQILFATTTNHNSEIINLKSFSNGIYFLRVVMDNGKVELRKFVKQ